MLEAGGLPKCCMQYRYWIHVVMKYFTQFLALFLRNASIKNKNEVDYIMNSIKHNQWQINNSTWGKYWFHKGVGIQHHKYLWGNMARNYKGLFKCIRQCLTHLFKIKHSKDISNIICRFDNILSLNLHVMIQWGILFSKHNVTVFGHLYMRSAVLNHWTATLTYIWRMYLTYMWNQWLTNANLDTYPYQWLLQTIKYQCKQRKIILMMHLYLSVNSSKLGVCFAQLFTESI